MPVALGETLLPQRFRGRTGQLLERQPDGSDIQLPVPLHGCLHVVGADVDAQQPVRGQASRIGWHQDRWQIQDVDQPAGQ